MITNVEILLDTLIPDDLQLFDKNNCSLLRDLLECDNVLFEETYDAHPHMALVGMMAPEHITWLKDCLSASAIVWHDPDIGIVFRFKGEDDVIDFVRTFNIEE